MAAAVLDDLIEIVAETDGEHTLPSDFGDDLNGVQIQELLIMTKCAYNLFSSNNSYQIKQQISSIDPLFNGYLNYFLSNYQQIDKNNELLLSSKMTTAIYTILSDYNYYIRLKLENKGSLSKLHEMESTFNPSLLPPPTPSEIILPELWLESSSKDQDENKNEWIGHGYYYKHGTGPKLTDLCIDYDGLEDKFIKLTKAKVIMADYKLLQKDFNKHLSKMNESQINEWLIENCAYFAQGQINRMLMKYENNQNKTDTDNIDIKHYLHFDDNLTINDYIDLSPKSMKPGLRQRGGGRAATFLIDNKYKITSNGQFVADMLDVKGVGTHILCNDLAQDKNGFLSAVDAMIEFLYQKLIQRIFDIENEKCNSDGNQDDKDTQKHNWGTVQMYGVIDTGLRFKDEIENPATGYKGDRIALIIRQRHSRLNASEDEPCFFSVAQQAQLMSEQGKKLREILLKYGITSEQIPTSYLLGDGVDVDGLNGDWNIQSDAGFCHLVDFSQFYCLPVTDDEKDVEYELELKEWRMSMSAFKLGCKLGRVFNDFGEKMSEDMLREMFMNGADGDEKEVNLEEIKMSIEKEQDGLKKKWGDLVGLRKPKHAWSWFLETDDSKIFEWAKKSVNERFGDCKNDNMGSLFDEIPLP